MTLLEYIKNNASETMALEKQALYNQYESVEEYIVSEVCPVFFKCLEGTEYEKPLKKLEDGYCKYDDYEFKNKCIECWNRKVLVSEAEK